MKSRTAVALRRLAARGAREAHRAAEEGTDFVKRSLFNSSEND